MSRRRGLLRPLAPESRRGYSSWKAALSAVVREYDYTQALRTILIVSGQGMGGARCESSLKSCTGWQACCVPVRSPESIIPSTVGCCC